MQRLAVLALLAPHALAQSSSYEAARLTPNDLTQQANFGWSVALDGDTLAAGAPVEPGGGAVYVFRRSGALWQLESRLQHAGSAGLGLSVALSGDRLVVGDPGASNGTTASGGAFVFERNGTTWTETAQLFASDGDDGHEFGRALAIDGSRVLVGAARAAPEARGAAYVFVWNGASWAQEARLAASDGVNVDQFGTAVDLQGDTALVGVPDHMSMNGAAYVFTRSGASWSEQQKLQPSGGVAPYTFGSAVALDGDRLFVGAPRDGLAGALTGSVRVFTRAGGTWSASQVLVPPDAGSTIFTARFGSALAHDGVRLAIGAPVDYTIGGPAAGSIYVFEESSGKFAFATKLLTRDRQIFDWFATAVALQGDTVVGGVYADAGEPGSSGFDNGSTRVFELSAPTGTASCFGTTAACPCAQPAGTSALGNGCGNSQQEFGAGLWAFGAASVANDGLVLRCEGLPYSASLTIAQGSSAAGSVFGDGSSCVAGSLVRIVTRLAYAGALLYPELGQAAVSLRGAIPPAGGTRTYQAVYRNSAAYCTPATFNTTNALEIVWAP